MLIVILKDLEVQRHLLRTGRSRTLSLRQLKKLIDSINRVEHHLQELEAPNQEAL
jgi:uncharacterized protein (UPF0335 family)